MYSQSFTDIFPDISNHVAKVENIHAQVEFYRLTQNYYVCV